MISAAFPYQKRRRRVLGSEMAYVQVGEGDPIVLLHGNPTSVDPLPALGSSSIPLRGTSLFISDPISASGFCVGWNMCAAGIFGTEPDDTMLRSKFCFGVAHAVRAAIPDQLRAYTITRSLKPADLKPVMPRP